MLAIFIHLDDTDPSNGGLGVFPGSHLRGPQVIPCLSVSLTLNACSDDDEDRLKLSSLEISALHLFCLLHVHD